MLTVNLNTLPRDGVKVEEIMSRQPPPFAAFAPDYQLLYSLAGKYAGTSNFIVIGRDGASFAFKALYTALAKYHTTKRVSVIDCLDPDYLSYVRQKFRPEDSLVIMVAERGDDPFAIQGLLAFQEYKKLLVTGEGALYRYGSLRELEMVRYPAINSRFTIGTEAALLPAAIIYVDVKSIVNGMHAVYRQCDPGRPFEENPALQLAAALLVAERHGFHDVFVPIYSKALSGSGQFLSHLMAGLGPTFVFGEAPAAEHHGPVIFLRVERPIHDVEISPDYHISGVQEISSYAGVRLSEATAKFYEDERRGLGNLPSATITLDVLNPGTFGELFGFWQYVAVYSAWLRGLDPFV